ncbi:T9SS type A sorting domain-containing protein [Paucihalobacter ruber]|uniref:T9SS type A sorting domain-containing protein n=1 Tax=Paucihalobacter ruber TaxID=2567861 RepID=A0A506PIG7_9FLAO|nr:Ig-like domain-containing protein [Paucihalobacter ruber]TPV33374.1 T9SS type A sorting domain-containing protein [Paucihalobacter ruber]
MRNFTIPTLLDFKTLFLFLFVFSWQLSFAQQIAFPTAVGAGAYTTGGRGGIVVHVTNLNDSGAGSLREALSMTVPRIIVFDVSGVININKFLYLSGVNSNFTLAGQTAPEGGITIAGGRVYFSGVTNYIMRHIRFKGGFQADWVPHSGDDIGSASFSGVGNNVDIIVDHVSFGFGKTMPTWIPQGDNPDQFDKVTIQNCLFSETDKGAIVGKDVMQPTYRLTGDMTFIRNIFYNTRYRVPNVSGNHGPNNSFDVINNLTWRNDGRFTNGGGDMNLNHINNAIYVGPFPIWDRTLNLWVDGRGFNPKIYTSGNLIYETNINSGSLTYSVDQMNSDNTLSWKYFVGDRYGEQLPSSFFVNTAYPIRGVSQTILPASELKSILPYDSGCNARLNADGSVSSNLDTHDAEFLENIINNVFPPAFDISNVSLDPITTNTRPSNFYISNPHIPEIWFQANVPAGQDHNDIAPSGYTWLEEYLNMVDRDTNAIALESIAVTPNTAEIQIPNTIALTATFTPSNATNQTGTWKSSNESIATVDGNGLVTPVSPGVVFITFTANDGGFKDTAEIRVFPEALQASAGDDQQICEGESATLTATGGTGYLWSTGETTATITVSPEETTTYMVTVTDDYEQSDTAEVTVTVNPIPTANAGEDQSICAGDSVTLTASGGSSYLWSNGTTTQSITVTPNQTTTYTVEVTENGCSSSDEVTVTINPAPPVNAGNDVTIGITQSVNLTASGATSYTWNTGETGESITVSPTETTTYVVTGTTDGCSAEDEVTVFIAGPITAVINGTTSICQGDSTTLTVEGGTGYLWSTGETTASITVSPEETTTYMVTVTDDYEQSDTAEVTVTMNPIPTANAGEDQSICAGESITLTASGGSSYLWSNGATTQSITVTPNQTTTYTVEVTENGCSSSDEVTVTINPAPPVNAGNDVTIGITQSVNLTASGATSYIWNTGETGESITVSSTETTTYIVTGTTDGCSAEDEVTVFIAGPITAVINGTTTICQGESTTITVEGGTNFLWNNGETTASITVSPNATTQYSVEVSDDYGNFDTAEVEVTVNPIPTANAGEDQSICAGDSVTLTASGGSSYLWSNGATTQSINVSPNQTTTYSVEVTENGCSSSDEVTVTINPAPPVNAGNDVTIGITQSVNLTASGATSYIWNTGETGESITVSPTETTTYIVTGTTDGCSAEDEVTVFIAGPITAVINGTTTICQRESTTITVEGGTNFLWNNGETTASITVSPNATTQYSVEVSDDYGNFDTAEVEVTVNPIPTANAGEDQSICAGDSVTLTASGGSSYLWSNGATTQSINVSPNQTTTYSVEVADNGCSSTDQVTVSVTAQPELQITGSTNIVYGQSTTLTVSGAESYSWNNGSNSNSITVQPETTTTYEVTGFINNCFSTASVTVVVESNVQASAGEDQRICQGYEVTLTANGGSSYLWSTGATTQSITVSPASNTIYTVTVFNGPYQDSDSVNVFVDPNPNVTVINGAEATVLEGNFITLSARGANTYQWSNGATQPNIAVRPSVTTTYEVRGFINDCYDEKAITVNVVPRVEAYAGEDITICAEESAILTATGGDDYLWSTGETTQSIEVSPEETTLYTVTVFNELDFDEASVMVMVDQECESVVFEDNDLDANIAFLVYPNPVSETLYIQLNNAVNVSIIQMFDVAGKLLFTEQIGQENEVYSFQKEVDVRTFQSGLYFVRFVDNDQVITKKILVQ